MTTKTYLIAMILIVACRQTFGQHLALTINDAGKKGMSVEHLDSIYKSAVHVDTAQAVFKTESEQGAMFEAYSKLLQDFGKFLTKNNFKWESPTKGFNRIYFNKDGTIDYFLYNFSSDISQEKQMNSIGYLIYLLKITKFL
jgi:hypothetical protein